MIHVHAEAVRNTNSVAEENRQKCSKDKECAFGHILSKYRRKRGECKWLN